jgi:hypothetical protein
MHTMFTTSAAEFLAAYSPERFPATHPATARAVFLVSPEGFSLASESARDNVYMRMAEPTDPGRALAEHAALARALASEIPVVTFPGDPTTPDAVFPNNVWGTTRGRLIVGRMRHAVRRRESERRDLRAFFEEVLGYDTLELPRGVAELTGSLVIDRARGIGFCGLSERCDLAGARAMHDAFELSLTYAFPLRPDEYHLNVLLAVLAGRAAILHRGSLADPEAAGAIAAVYPDRVLELDDREKAAFAGNAIALGEDAVWMSAGAAAALRPASRAALLRWGFEVRTAALPEIEKAGGSLRCCVAEIY